MLEKSPPLCSRMAAMTSRVWLIWPSKSPAYNVDPVLSMEAVPLMKMSLFFGKLMTTARLKSLSYSVGSFWRGEGSCFRDRFFPEKAQNSRERRLLPRTRP